MFLKKRILFICPGPFGSLTDTYFYYIHLKEQYDITYIGFAEKHELPNLDNIKIIHLPGGSTGLAQKLSFYKKIKELLKLYHFDFIFINYFIGCSVIKFFAKNKIIIDVRTSYIFENRFKRFFYNAVLSTEVHGFSNITVISQGLSDYLNLPKRSHVLPLGAPVFPIVNKSFDSFNIIYVGTFFQREIYKTIFSFARFYQEYNRQIPIKYTIIGFGSDCDVKKVETSIENLGMKEHIFFKGKIRYPELAEYLKEHNIGISYIPLKKHFDFQPPTKTFEYLLSGMAVIATSTNENKKVVNSTNGVLIDDTVEGIYNGFVEVFSRRSSYNSEDIQKDALKYSWGSIIEDNLIPYLDNI